MHLVPCRALPSEASGRPAASPAGVAGGPEPASSATSGAAHSDDFDVKPKVDVLQLSKVFKAPTTFRELQVACNFDSLPPTAPHHTSPNFGSPSSPAVSRFGAFARA